MSFTLLLIKMLGEGVFQKVFVVFIVLVAFLIIIFVSILTVSSLIEKEPTATLKIRELSDNSKRISVVSQQNAESVVIKKDGEVVSSLSETGSFVVLEKEGVYEIYSKKGDVMNKQGSVLVEK